MFIRIFPAGIGGVGDARGDAQGEARGDPRGDLFLAIGSSSS